MDKVKSVELISRIKKGEQNAFKEFYEEFFPRVYKYAERRVKNREVAEDITSETFFKVLKGLSCFVIKGDNALDVWIYSIERNVVRDWFRKNAGVDLLPFEEAFSDVLSSIVDDPYSTAEREEVKEYIVSALEEIPEQYREVIELRFYKMKKIKDIALELEKSVDAVKVTQFRALSALKEKVEEKLHSGQKRTNN